MKFNVDGREVEDYNLSNNDIKDLLHSEDITDEQRKLLRNAAIKRFENNLCKRDGETNDDVFVRQFSNFVNGKMDSSVKVAELMARDHRYLQQEMFKVCYEYIRILAKNYEQGLGYYDARNEWACKTSHKFMEGLKDWY